MYNIAQLPSEQKCRACISVGLSILARLQGEAKSLQWNEPLHSLKIRINLQKPTAYNQYVIFLPRPGAVRRTCRREFRQRAFFRYFLIRCPGLVSGTWR